MSAQLAIAQPRRIKATHRRRRKVTAGPIVQRYYDPQIGRFLGVDPAASEFNRYNYASNNPYRFTDPDGRQSNACGVTGCDSGSFGPGTGETPAAEQHRKDKEATARRNKEAAEIATWWVNTAWKLFKSQFEGDTPAVGLAGGVGLLREGELISSEASAGFRTFDSFKRAVGPAGEGMQWHHIVEQTRGNVARFGANAIHNPNNLVRLETSLHQRISGFYSSKQAFTNGQTVRAWLSTKPLAEQRQFGNEVMEAFGAQ